MSGYERHDWLRLRVEEPIDATRPIVDAHHHLWYRAASTYLAPELGADTTGSHNVTHTVFVECSSAYDGSGPTELRPVGETRFVAAEAARLAELGPTQLGAIVSFADMRLGDAVEDVLAAHEAAGAGLFRGVRHGVNWSASSEVKNGHHDPTSGLMADAQFRRGVMTLGRLGFSFDAWSYFDQLGELADLARAVPDCTFVLNHLGGPLGIGPHARDRAAMRSAWAAGMASVAACPNVVVKVGGIGMDHYFGMGWAELAAPPPSEAVAAYWADIVHRIVELFGPDRCMFESNYPVDRQTLPYPVLWNAFQILAEQYDGAEQDSLFRATAARVYRIADA